MEKTNRFNKICPFPIIREVNGEPVKMLFELSMYATRKEYYASVVHKGKIVQDWVELDSYGLFVTEIYEEGDSIRKSDPIDLGVKSAHPRHVNSFIHKVCRSPIADVKAIKAAYNDEAASEAWCNGWPDALAQVASVELSRSLSSTDLQPFTERVRAKRNRLLGKLNPFRDMPNPHSKNNGGFDA
jgi:hypothetical protein